MSQRFASSQKALAICDICGFQYKLRELKEYVKSVKELKVELSSDDENLLNAA